MSMELQHRTAEMAPGPMRWVEHFRVGSLAASGRELLHWWRGQLLSMVPARLRHLIAEPRLLAEASAHEVCIYRPEQREVLGRVVWQGEQDARSLLDAFSLPGAGRSLCDVVLDRGLVLETSLSLPLEAERNLRRVLAYSMDRYTPFGEAEVYFDFRVMRRDTGNRKIDVLLYVAPRKVVDAIVGRLAQFDLDAAAVDIAGTVQGARAGIDLLPAAPHGNNPLKTRLHTALAGSAGLLLLLVLAVPLWHRHQAVAELEDALGRVLPQVQAAERLQAVVNERVAQVRQIHLRKEATLAMLDVLLELTRLVPDEAWAGQVEIKDGRVRLSGEAVAASEMVQTLTDSGYFSDPRFESPLTQNPKNGRERFVISLAVRGRGHAG